MPSWKMRRRWSPKSWWFELLQSGDFKNAAEAKEAIETTAERISAVSQCHDLLIREVADLFGTEDGLVRESPFMVLVPLLDVIRRFGGRERDAMVKALLKPESFAGQLRQISGDAMNMVHSMGARAAEWKVGRRPRSRLFGDNDLAARAALTTVGVYPPEPNEGEKPCVDGVLGREQPPEFADWWRLAGGVLRHARNSRGHLTTDAAGNGQSGVRPVDANRTKLAPHVIALLALVATRFVAWEKETRLHEAPQADAILEDEVRRSANRGLSGRDWVTFAGGALLATAILYNVLDDLHSSAPPTLALPGGTAVAMTDDGPTCSAYTAEASAVTQLEFRLVWGRRPRVADEPWATSPSIRALATELAAFPIKPGAPGRIFVITGMAGIGKSPAAVALVATLCGRRHVQLLRKDEIAQIHTTGWSRTPPGSIVVLDDFDKLRSASPTDVASDVRLIAQKSPTTFIIFTREPVEGWFPAFEGFAWKAELQPFSPEEGLTTLREELAKSPRPTASASHGAPEPADWTPSNTAVALQGLGLSASSNGPAAAIRTFYDAEAYAQVIAVCWHEGSARLAASCTRFAMLAALDAYTDRAHHDHAVHASWRLDPHRPAGTELVGALLDAWEGCAAKEGDRDSEILGLLHEKAGRPVGHQGGSRCRQELERALDALAPTPAELNQLL